MRPRAHHDEVGAARLGPPAGLHELTPRSFVGSVQAVPAGAALLFGTVGALGLLVGGVSGHWAFGLIVLALFGPVAAVFAVECIPSAIWIDSFSIRVRKGLRTQHIAWTSVSSIGRGITLGEGEASVLVRALRADGVATESVALPVVEGCDKETLHDLCLTYWVHAGGAGDTFNMATRSGRWPRASQRLVSKGSGDVDLHAEDTAYCRESLVVNNSGEVFCLIVVGHDDVDELLGAVRRAVHRAAKDLAYNPQFSGLFAVSLVPDLAVSGPDLERAMDHLAAVLPRELMQAGLAPAVGREIAMIWRQTEIDALASETR